MKNKFIIPGIVMGLALSSLAQTSQVIVPTNIRLLKDTALAANLIKTLNGFLDEKEKLNKENSFVLKEDLLETSALLDEMKGIEKSGKFKDDHFYKCYLSNLLKLDSTHFLIQFSYIGVNENIPLLRASFRVLLKKRDEKFYVYSPLKRHTASWKMQKIGSMKVFYQSSFNTAKAKNYFSTIERFDKKLNYKPKSSYYYACSDYAEALQLLGVDYRSDYNGSTSGALAAGENESLIRVDGSLIPNNYEFDPHDLWHSRLRRMIAPSVINRPVDEGTAYLYGGSWGLSWNTILEKFKAYAKANPNADWIALYNESKKFGGEEKSPLNVDFAINALFVREIEKEKGFPSVIELVSCGKKEEGNENYFKTLEKITGVKKENFNTKIWSMVKEEAR